MKCICLRVIVFIPLLFLYSEASVIGNISVTPSGQVGLNDCYSANSLGFTKLLFTLSGRFSYDTDLIPQMDRYVIFNSVPIDTIPTHPFTVLYALYPAIAFGVTDFMDIALMQPIYIDIVEDFLPEGGIGDLKLSLKCRVPGSRQRLIEGALLSEFTIGNGNRSKGFIPREGYYIPKNSEDMEVVPPEMMSFFTARKPTWTWVLLGTLGKRRFYFHANLGVRLTFESLMDHALVGALGFEYHPAEWVSIYTDASASPRFKQVAGGNLFDDPLHVSPGVTFRAPGGALLSIGGSLKLSSNNELSYLYRKGDTKVYTRSEPLWQIFVQLGWNGFIVTRDKDGDQIRDKDDKCPDVAEDIDNFDDQDGCPDTDNDNDKVPDQTDSCRNVPEDLDGFNDSDGCPEMDNDTDAVVDSLDKCPDSAEDRDGFEDDDGCPDPDNDADGVPDSTDKCMGVAEDRDGFQDDDGCPDSDNDQDAIPDSLDNCPDSAGNAEAQGCPKPKEKAKEIRYGRLILSGVSFEGGTADLTPGSAADLDRVYQSLSDWPEVTVEIQAHTDNTLSAKASFQLSQQRADIVREYLLQKGILPSRVSAIGKGSAEPIADNTSVQGRRLNSRIEIHRNDRK